MMADDVAYCINGDGRLAVGEGTPLGIAIMDIPGIVDGLVEYVELKCAVCLGLVQEEDWDGAGEEGQVHDGLDP